jgi:16S rRNA (guanine527-N7)-methyltransferase
VLREELLRHIDGLTDKQLGQLVAHFELLRLWNAKLNLTRIAGDEDTAIRHYGESIFLARQLPPGPLQIADIGSGAGFPGIPLAIVRPECQVMLVESHKRKSVFLREATRMLANVHVKAVRGEDVTDSFDWVVSRAVAWEDLARFVFRLAPNVAILSGELELPDSTRLPLPSGDRRFLTFVSRET